MKVVKSSVRKYNPDGIHISSKYILCDFAFIIGLDDHVLLQS